MRDASPIIGPVTIKNDFNKCMSFFNEKSFIIVGHFIVGGRDFQKLSHLEGGGGVPKSLLEREDNSEKGGLM